MASGRPSSCRDGRPPAETRSRSDRSRRCSARGSRRITILLMMLVNAGHSFAVGLRREINARNAALVKSRELLHVESYGAQPVIVYEPSEDGKLHGNFVEASY